MRVAVVVLLAVLTCTAALAATAPTLTGRVTIAATRPGAAISPLRVTARHGVTRRITFVLRLNAA